MAKNIENIEGVRCIFEINKLVRSDTDQVAMFELVLRIVTEAVGCHSGSIFIHNVTSGKLEEAATVGERVDLIEGIDFDMGSGFSAWVAKQRRTVLIPNLRKNQQEGFRSFLSTPLVSADKLIGVMNLGHDEPESFTENHMNFLEIVAAQLAYAIERSNFERELIAKNTALESARKEIDHQQNRIVEMEKEQVLAQVAASINHEINNPLTTVIGTIELMLMTNPDLEGIIKSKLETVLAESRRIATIIEKIRHIKKIVVEDYLDKYGDKMIDINSNNN